MLELSEKHNLVYSMPIENAECVSVKAGHHELRGRLFRNIQIQEINMLAFTLSQLDKEQLELFLSKVQSEPSERMHCGTMLNYALSVCPEAAGFERGGDKTPQYSGNNLFELMEYKRFQDYKLQYLGFQIVKCYFPVSVMAYYSNGSERELSSLESVKYRAQFSEIMDNRIRRREDQADWEWYCYFSKSESQRERGILFERHNFEERNGELFRLIAVGMTHCLKPREVERMREYMNDYVLDTLLERIYTVPLPGVELELNYDNCTEILQQARGELNLTEQEMFELQAPFNVQHLSRHSGFEPDFCSDWDYRKKCPIWLEFSYNRRKVRISLPADKNIVSEVGNKIGVNQNSRLCIMLKVPSIFILNDMWIYKLELPILNQLADEVYRMDKSSQKALEELCMQEKWGREQNISYVIQTLKQIREGTDKVHDIGSVTEINGPGM